MITALDGTRHIERADGTIEVLNTHGTDPSRPSHGRLGDPAWPPPRLAVECGALARPGYRPGCAHEYLDDEAVLRAKVALLASLLRDARHTVVYGGAGLSTASGIPDYATKTGAAGVLAGTLVEQVGKTGGDKDCAAVARGGSGRGKGPELPVKGKGSQGKGRGKGKGPSKAAPASMTAARPNYGHRALAALGRRGMIWRFVQQNHDGLPQKAGLPQRIVNEIHGGLFDPSNPVVRMNGSVRDDLFQDLLLCERKADLVIAVGSSLSGMNADRLVKTCAERALASKNPSLGAVIISLQTTPHDWNSSVRIYSTIDRTMELLAESLSLEVAGPEYALAPPPSEHRPDGPEQDVFAVPYDEQGRLLDADAPRRRWDLRPRSLHTVTAGPLKGARAMILGKTEDGQYRVGIRWDANFQGDYQDIRSMGSWWVDAAICGDVASIPLVSQEVTGH